jgi:hypothetical protein
MNVYWTMMTVAEKAVVEAVVKTAMIVAGMKWNVVITTSAAEMTRQMGVKKKNAVTKGEDET